MTNQLVYIWTILVNHTGYYSCERCTIKVQWTSREIRKRSGTDDWWEMSKLAISGASKICWPLNQCRNQIYWRVSRRLYAIWVFKITKINFWKWQIESHWVWAVSSLRWRNCIERFLWIEMYEHLLCLSLSMHILLSDMAEFRNHYANFVK